MGIEVSGVAGILILIADIWALINVVQARAEVGAKVLWSVLIVLLPIIGFLIWLFAGPRAATKL